MRKESTFLASAEIARRAGVITTNYRTKDGRYIVSEKALRALSIMPEEYVNGLDVEIISEAEAERLIAENGYQIGVPAENTPKETSGEEPADGDVNANTVDNEVESPVEGESDTPGDDVSAEEEVEQVNEEEK